MSRSPQDVLAGLLALTPPGAALPTDTESMWARMLKPLAAEISRFESYAEEMFTEVNPLEANYLLPDFERVLGPDPYGRQATALTIGQQQQLAYSRWTQKQGARPADFVALAATFGITITIREYVLTKAGCFAGTQCVDHPNEYSWLINMPAVALETAQAGAASAGDLQSAFEPSLVQPAITARAPAQTTPVFSYA